MDNLLVTKCELAPLTPGRGDRSRYRRILEEKRSSQPLAGRSAGCVFKNPEGPGLPPAGRLIEELGFKGHRVGGARVSARHANFLLCEGNARARDVLELIHRIRQRAWRERGVRLELEIALWGLSEEELGPPEAAA